MFDWLQLGVALVGAIGIFFLGLGVLTFAKRSKEMASASGDDIKVSLHSLNEKAKKVRLGLQHDLLKKDDLKILEKEEKKRDKEQEKLRKATHKNKDSSSVDKDARKRVFVFDFHGDIQASQVLLFREAINAVAPLLRKDKDEVVVRVESPGGVVHGYGLAAAQILRLREACARLVVCVDKVAASGGYMIACTAHEVISSPFAIIGSIGAVAGVPNLNRLLKDKKIDYYEMTAGRYKRTVSMLGEVTEEKLEKAHQQLEDVHHLFKSHVSEWRPALDMDAVATGEFWYGKQAIGLGLVDRIMTSDSYLAAQLDEADVYEVRAKEKENLRSKIFHKALFSAARLAGFRLENEWNYPVGSTGLFRNVSLDSKVERFPLVVEKFDSGM